MAILAAPLLLCSREFSLFWASVVGVLFIDDTNELGIDKMSLQAHRKMSFDK